MSKRGRIEALEARVAALEASNSPGGLGDTPDNTPGGDVCGAVCRACQGSGYADYAAVPCPACETVPPEAAPVPQWRARVDEQHYEIVGSRATPLEDVLMCLAEVERTKDRTALARIVAVCEGQVGDGWKADPDGIVLERVVQWLLGPLSRNDWETLANRAAAWLRSLTDGAS